MSPGKARCYERESCQCTRSYAPSPLSSLLPPLSQEAIDDAEQMIELAPESEKGYILKANAYICLAQHALEGGVRAMTTPESREIIQKHMNALEAATFV